MHERDVSSLMTQAKETIGKEVTFSPGAHVPLFLNSGSLLVRVRLRRILAPRCNS